MVFQTDSWIEFVFTPKIIEITQQFISKLITIDKSPLHNNG